MPSSKPTPHPSSILIAPTEPMSLKAIGQSSSVPERYGCDVLLSSAARGLCGIQRKEFTDFLASIHDGRLNRELASMSRLHTSILLIEGRPRWSTDGHLMTGSRFGYKWTLNAHLNFLRSVQELGVWVETTDSLSETIVAVRAFQDWLSKGKHLSLRTRPRPRGAWGEPTSAEFCSWVLQSFPGIGPTQAEAILEHFGRLPLQWDVSAEEMMGVKGMGKVRVDNLFKGLGQLTEAVDVPMDEAVVG